MSLHSFLGIGPPPPKKTTEERKVLQKQYEKEKWVRTFQPSWKITYKWLSFTENKGMMCDICTRYEKMGSFVSGCTNFHLETIRKHENSEGHIMNTKKSKVISD